MEREEIKQKAWVVVELLTQTVPPWRKNEKFQESRTTNE